MPIHIVHAFAKMKIDKFNAHSLSHIVNAFAKINYHHMKLFGAVGTTSISIIKKMFSKISSSVTKLNHSNPALFEKVATATILILGKFDFDRLCPS